MNDVSIIPLSKVKETLVRLKKLGSGMSQKKIKKPQTKKNHFTVNQVSTSLPGCGPTESPVPETLYFLRPLRAYIEMPYKATLIFKQGNDFFYKATFFFLQGNTHFDGAHRQ